MNFSQLDFGIFAIKFYGFFVALAFFIAAWHFYKEIQKQNLSTDFFVHHFWKWIVSAIFVGRIISILSDLTIFNRSGIFSFFTFWDGGISFWGISLGFISAAIFDLRIHKENFAKWGDSAISSIIIGLLILDIAGFITGAIYGKETSMIWGISYETFDVDLLKPIHPVTIYAAIAHFWILRRIQKRKNAWGKIPGKIFFYGIFLIFMTDFFTQFFRGDPGIHFFEIFRISAFFDIIIMISLLIFMKKNKLLGK